MSLTDWAICLLPLLTKSGDFVPILIPRRSQSRYPEPSSILEQQVCYQTHVVPVFDVDQTLGLLHREETAVPSTSSKRKAVSSADSSDDEDDNEDWGNHGNMQVTLHIANEDEVLHFLKMRFTQIQQLATKVIAKAWIKAICPKKQANYPYVDSNPRADQNQKRRRPKHDGAPRIPTFWPDISLCRHKEPDHTRKTGMLFLCRLIRLS